MRNQRAPSPATLRRRCWPTPGRRRSSSAIRSGGPFTRKPTRRCAPRRIAAWRAGLIAIVCIGETKAEREAGQTLDVLGRQLDGSLPDGATGANLVVAYEPVWAIGTGLTPTVADVAQAHGFIRGRLAERYGAAAQAIRILYGGSVKASNAKELMAAADVDGALVGGASLKADEFLAIAGVYR